MYELAEKINDFAAEAPTARTLQDLRDILTDQAREMLRVMLEETQP